MRGRYLRRGESGSKTETAKGKKLPPNEAVSKKDFSFSIPFLFHIYLTFCEK